MSEFKEGEHCLCESGGANEAMKSPGYIISHQIQNFFHYLGLLVYRYTALFFYIPLFITAFSAVGLARFNEENRVWYLYSPSNAPSHLEHAIANEFFNDRGGKFWVELPITSRDSGNLLRDGYLEEVEQIADFLQFNLSIPCSISKSGRCSFHDLCSGPCNDNQVIPIFRLIYRNESRRLHPNFRLTYPTMHIYNDEYYVGEHFAGVSINNITNRIRDIRVIVLYFRTDRQNRHISEAIDRWETSLLAYASSFRHPFINISCSSDGMFSSEVRRNGLSCIPYFALSVAFVFTFIFVTNHIRSSEIFSYKDAFMVALFGTLGPVMAVATTFNLMFAMGFAFNSITLVVPFLIIGAGCDDVFIIVHAWRKTNRSDQLDARIAKTMEEAGPSITVTSLTNGLSFGVGGLANTPAIRLFCAYAAVGVLIDFIYQITFFAAAMVYEGNRLTKVSESKSKIALEMQKIREENCIPGSHNGIVSKYCCQLKKWQCRVIILIALLLYWIVAIYNCHRMTIKMDSTNLLLRDSPLNNVAWIYERYLWREGSLVHIFINNPPDLSLKSNQLSILEMVSRFESLPHSMGKNSTSLWLRSFLSQISMFSSEQNNRFYELLDEWLKDSDDGGGRWNDMIRLRHINGSAIGVERFMFATASAMGDHASWTLRAQLQEQWRQLARKYQHYNVTIFQPYSFYVDQLNSIKPTTASTIVVAMTTMALACVLMIPSASSIISSTLAMISINVGVFGGLSILGVHLDPLAMCTTLMSIGFSVDFTAHISYHYYRCPRIWPSDMRLADALRSIGWPMVQAGISTILSVSPLLLIDSYMVLVFIKTIFLVIGLGLLHGIVFLPVLLLTIGVFTISDNPQPHPPLAHIYIKSKFERVLSVPQPSVSSQGKESLRRIEASHSL